MQKILYIVDNKYRDLWGFDNLKEELEKNFFKLYFCNKFNWQLAVKAYNPQFVIIPTAPNLAVQEHKIVDYLHKRKIKIIMCPSEGLDYSSDFLKHYFPENIVKKILKFFLWAKAHGRLLEKMGYKKKIVVSGTLRFSDELDYSKNSKVKVIGITTSGRFCTSGIEKEINIPKFLHTRRRVPINFLKTEVELLDTLSLLFKHFSKSNYKFLLKPHPFESVGIYERAFPGIKIDDSKDIRTFLSKIDVLLNHESSANFHALRYKIPVISLRKMVNSHPGFKKSLSEYAPYLIGIPVKNFYELEKILNNKQNILFKKNINNKDLKLIEKTAPLLNSPKIIASELLKHKKEFTNINAIAYIKFLLKEIYLYSVIKRKTLFHPFNLSDKKLLKSFRVHRGKNLRKGK